MVHTRYFSLLVFSLLLTLSASAQRGQGRTASSQPVDAATVPAAVTSSFSAAFPGVTVAQWYKQASNGKEGYTAHFAQDGKKAKARIGGQGVYRWSSVHHTVAQTPQALKDAAVAANPGFTLAWAKKIYAVEKKFTYYKVRMRKTGATLTSYFDENLQPISQQSVKQLSSEAEAETEDEG